MSGTAARIRVLHVDDEPDLGDMVATFLEREDDRLEVDTVTSAAAGLELLAEHDVDCVVSDYEMPGQNGIEFLRAVREEYPELPFLLYTGKGSEEVAADAISAGVTDYLQKDRGTDQYTVLANRITNAVESHWSKRALTERNRDLRRYERMINSMQEAACVYDADGRFEIVNEYLADWYGTTRDALKGQRSNLIPHIRAQADGDPYQALLDGDREQLRGEISAEFPSHGAAVVEYQLTPLRIDGEIDGVVAVARDVTEQKRRDQRLKQTTSRLEALFEQSPDMINVHDSDGRIIDPNPELVAKTGYDAADLTEMQVWDIDQAIDPDEAKSLWRGMDRGDRVRREGMYRRRDGSTFPAEAHIRRVDIDGADRFVVISRDITDRKQREQDLERYERILEAAGDAVYALDLDGHMTTVNDRLLELTGYDREELLGEHVSVVLDAADIERGRETIHTLLTTDQAVAQYEQTVRTADGATVPVEVRITLLEDDDGTVRGSTGIIRDITERKARERKLRQLQARTEPLIRASSAEEIAEIAVDIAVNVLELPLSGVHLADPDEEQLVPVAVSDAVREHLGEAPTYDRTAPTRSVDTINWEFYEQGEPVVIDDAREDDRIPDTETPSRSGIIQPLGDHGLFITSSPEPHAFDDGDVALTELLAQLVTASLDRVDREAALREQNDRLEAKTERLDAFASVLSHDLRNPLSVAQGRLELARAQEDSEHLQAIARAQGRMEALIEDLLTLARQGEAASDITTVDLATLGADCWDTVETGTASLVTDLDRSIRADESRVRQLFENLMRNAVEHGGEDVTVTIGALDDGFYVADDGPGIPPADRERVFEAGYSTSREGTGFGLSIVKQIVDAHGWEIRVTDSAAGGARFEVTGVEFDDA